MQSDWSSGVRAFSFRVKDKPDSDSIAPEVQASEVASGPAGEQPPVAAAKPKPYGWILHPAIDLMLVCGGLIWIFAIMMACGVVPHEPKSTFMTTTLITALILFSMPHQTATYLRVYDDKVTRDKLGKLVAFFGLVCLGLGALVVVSPLWASIIGRITLGFSFQHFYAQTYGIVLLYCVKRGFYLSKWEKNTLHALIYAGIWAAVTNVLCNRVNVGGFYLMQVASLPPWVRTGFDLAVVLLAVAFAGLMARRWFKSKQLIPWPAVLTLVSCFLFLGYLERNPSFIVIVILGQALFHSPQYLVVTLSYHIKSRGLPEGVPSNRIWTQLWRPASLKYLAFVLGSGWLISTLIGPYIPETLIKAGFNKELAGCAWYCAINLHHYIADGLIWKMRDKATLSNLVA
jgi:hypothetical protein